MWLKKAFLLGIVSGLLPIQALWAGYCVVANQPERRQQIQHISRFSAFDAFAQFLEKNHSFLTEDEDDGGYTERILRHMKAWVFDSAIPFQMDLPDYAELLVYLEHLDQVGFLWNYPNGELLPMLSLSAWQNRERHWISYRQSGVTVMKEDQFFEALAAFRKLVPADRENQEKKESRVQYYAEELLLIVHPWIGQVGGSQGELFCKRVSSMQECDEWALTLRKNRQKSCNCSSSLNTSIN